MYPHPDAQVELGRTGLDEQVAVTGTTVEGTKDTLDASFKFRYGALTKG